jgi:palmitoyltransferase ZDHHC2/15/20
MAEDCTSKCFRMLQYFPVVFICAVVIWSYWAYVVVMCIEFANTLAEKILYIFFYHVTLLLFLSSYFRTILQPYKTAPKEFHLSKDEVATLSNEGGDNNALMTYLRNIVVQRNLPVHTQETSGSPRYCPKCYIIKPDRAHHCSNCGMCHLKMDHHCPWVGTCVAYHNYKFFVLFLFYTLVFCSYIIGTTIAYSKKFIETASDSSNPIYRINILLLGFLACVFSLSVLILLVYHIYLVLINRTTLESSRPPVIATGPSPNAFHLGKRNNFLEVFGDSPLLWWLPISTSRGDGVHWKYSESIETMEQA